MNQTAHDCPTCNEELIEIDEANEIFNCPNCKQDYFGIRRGRGDSIILGKA